jgi:hypothetical protein
MSQPTFEPGSWQTYEADGPIGMIYTRQEGMKGLRPENPHDGHRSVLRLVGLARMHEGYTLAPDQVYFGARI